eukprot:116695-Pleurochrysis_carterae.AAC.2
MPERASTSALAASAATSAADDASASSASSTSRLRRAPGDITSRRCLCGVTACANECASSVSRALCASRTSWLTTAQSSLRHRSAPSKRARRSSNLIVAASPVLADMAATIGGLLSADAPSAYERRKLADALRAARATCTCSRRSERHASACTLIASLEPDAATVFQLLRCSCSRSLLVSAAALRSRPRDAPAASSAPPCCTSTVARATPFTLTCSLTRNCGGGGGASPERVRAVSRSFLLRCSLLSASIEAKSTLASGASCCAAAWASSCGSCVCWRYRLANSRRIWPCILSAAATLRCAANSRASTPESRFSRQTASIYSCRRRARHAR